MVRGLYIAGTNMLTSIKEIDVIGNNLANANTVGFKKDDLTIESFNDILITRTNGSNTYSESRHSNIEIEKNDDKYNLSTVNGFFRIMTEDGISNNKDVKFSVDSEGYLSTYYLNQDRSYNDNLGNKLIDSRGDAIYIGVNEYEINESGQVVVNGSVQNNLVKDVSINVIGTINSGVKETRTYVDHSQGQMKMTEKALDVALTGSGCFEVKSDDKSMYTRKGNFTLNDKNELVTIEGFNVQGINGNITLPDSMIGINEFGEIIKNDEIIEKLKIIDFDNIGDLRKVGDTYFIPVSNNIVKIKEFEGSVLQRYLENSNVDSISEMIKLINVNKNYESSQKMISTIDKTLEKVINEVGIVRG